MHPVKAKVVLLSGFLLTACSALQPAPTVTPTFTATASPTASYTLAPTSTLTLTPTATVTPKPSNTPLPTKTLAPPTLTPNALGFVLPTGEPVAEWNDIPVMPDAIAGEESQGGGYAFTIQGDIAAVQNYYTKELAKRNWILLTVGEGTTGNVIAIFTKGSDVLSVAIALADQQERLILVLLVPS